jgi:uncharacterized Zn finger protein (UPF0148 family)
MYGSERECGDASCRHCGAPIYFEVGPCGSRCPACGKDWEHTDEEIEEKHREMAKPVDWREEIRNSLEMVCIELNDIANPPPDVEIPKKDRQIAWRIIAEIKKLHATV